MSLRVWGVLIPTNLNHQEKYCVLCGDLEHQLLKHSRTWQSENHKLIAEKDLGDHIGHSVLCTNNHKDISGKYLLWLGFKTSDKSRGHSLLWGSPSNCLEASFVKKFIIISGEVYLHVIFIQSWFCCYYTQSTSERYVGTWRLSP